jgi:hypothetical protein
MTIAAEEFAALVLNKLVAVPAAENREKDWSVGPRAIQSRSASLTFSVQNAVPGKLRFPAICELKSWK